MHAARRRRRFQCYGYLDGADAGDGCQATSSYRLSSASTFQGWRGGNAGPHPTFPNCNFGGNGGNGVELIGLTAHGDFLANAMMGAPGGLRWTWVDPMGCNNGLNGSALRLTNGATTNAHPGNARPFVASSAVREQ